MAQRRMFNLKIVASDAFLDMPTSTRELYFQLGMYADDDGFVNPKKIIRMIGASDDDIKLLIVKRFILPFENGVVVIKHWLINNLIRKDFYQETIYLEEKNNLNTKENKAYTENVNNLSPQVRLGKVRLGKVRLGKVRLGKVRLGKVREASASLFEKFKSNPLWETLINKYPDRDYKYQFKLMLDWWSSKKKKEPRAISAFENWLKNTKPDLELQAIRRSEIKRKEDEERQMKIDATPQARPETLDNLKKITDNLKNKF